MTRRTLRRAAAAAALAATAACYHQYVAVARPDPEVRSESKTVYSYAWGLVHSKDTVAVCPETNAIDQLEVKANFGQTLLGLVTLGIVVPRRVIWHCSRPREGTGEIGLSR
ncbi:MAG TPA: hypothetical protein VF048_08140 [Gemmatimonadaceae bacterium]